ncbi:aminotransferase class I/II-fold pyridoxal phosphate-dependent enzyme [Streptomyces sp. M19]
MPHPVRFERVGDLGDRLSRTSPSPRPTPRCCRPWRRRCWPGPAPAAARLRAHGHHPALLEAVEDTWPFAPRRGSPSAAASRASICCARRCWCPATGSPSRTHRRPAAGHPGGAGGPPGPGGLRRRGPRTRLAGPRARRPPRALPAPAARPDPCGWTSPRPRPRPGHRAGGRAERDGAGGRRHRPARGPPAGTIGAHLPGRTVVVRSYSKAYGPDLRLAVIGGPRDVVDRARVLRTYGTGWTSRILQDALAHLLTDPASEERVREAARRYTLRREGLADRLAARGVRTDNRDGLMLWVPVADETSALVTLAARGVTVSPGSRFYLSTPPEPRIRVATARLSEDPAALDGAADLITLAARAVQHP